MTSPELATRPPASGRGMTIVEKLLSRRAGGGPVKPGDIVVVGVDTVVLVDLSFYDGMWAEPRDVFDPDKVVVIFDHVIPPHDKKAAAHLRTGREFAKRVGITRLHDVGGDQGIAHAIIAEVPYALPGGILVCADSHTGSAGALNCLARGLGAAEITYILAKGSTWFQVAPTVRYELTGALRPGVAGKDVLLHIAARYGSHEGLNVEFGGPGLATLSLDARRQITTMCAEISVDFGICEPDALLEAHLRERGADASQAVMPDPDAVYRDVRVLDLAVVEPMVAMPHGVIGSSVPVEQAAGTPINRAFIGSCANGTLQDLRDAARVLAGARVADGVNLVITPSSQLIYRQALSEGLIEILTNAGALVTASSCGMCGGFENALTAGDVCISSSTRNFRGRMGDVDAQIYLGSSTTVAASAVAGRIVGADASTATEVVR